MKILDRYLLREMGGPFAFGVLAFVLLFVSANILFRLTELVSELGLSLWTAGELFLLWLPGFVVLTFPLAALVAIMHGAAIVRVHDIAETVQALKVLDAIRSSV